MLGKGGISVSQTSIFLCDGSNKVKVNFLFIIAHIVASGTLNVLRRKA